MASTLIYGYGNPGRQDDGLGPALVEALQLRAIAASGPGLAFDTNYQLNVEDALLVSEHGRVIFVDAATAGDGPFMFRALEPAAAVRFSTHAMSPESVLALCEELYGRRPTAHLLTIRGYAWEPNADMTPASRSNLAAGLEFLWRNLGLCAAAMPA